MDRGSYSQEEWRPVFGYEATYEVSNLGRIRSRRRQGTKGGLIKIYPGSRGYACCSLRQYDVERSHDVHRFVALAFLGPKPPGREVRHLNGDRMDPRAANLAYGTRSENGLDKRHHGTDRNAAKTHCSKGHEFNEENTYRIASRPGTRYCRPCNHARSRAYYLAHRQVVKPRT